MNVSYFYLLLYHAPFFAMLFGILLLLYGLVFKNISILKAGLVTVLSATLLTLLVHFLEIGKHLPIQVASVTEEQEWMLQWGFWARMVVGAVALLGLLTTSSRPARAKKPKTWATVTLVVSFGAIILLLGPNLLVPSGQESLHQKVASENQKPVDHLE